MRKIAKRIDAGRRPLENWVSQHYTETMPAYYNEIEPYAAQWLRNLIAAGHIAPGDVDERSILEVNPEDLRTYTQCHFFAGIGGWSHALRLAGWHDDRPVWTGSCPCQPFSVAGSQRGSADERHLWPAFFSLISECRPSSVFGEQVAGAAGLAWLDHVCADLEGAGYAAAAANLCAASSGAPHIRQRLYWVADSQGTKRCGRDAMALPNSKELGRSSAHLCTHAWPGGYGDGSTLPISDVCAPSYGVRGRVGRLRAYGNAIVPQVAAAFVMANVRHEGRLEAVGRKASLRWRG